MFRQLKKTLVATAIASLTLGSIGPAFADSADTLPDMGTSAGSTLSIGQEMQMGDYYVRQLRGSAPLINDPLLVQYINGLGMRLVAHANSVRTPFHFYLINNDQINAFAFFGGNVVLHSALFRYSDNESELASVMAHEISHVTQRHLARAMEDQKRNAPLTWVGALGSILLAMAMVENGAAGDTKKQMEKTFGMRMSELNQWIRAWSAVQPQEDADTKSRMNIANAVWYNNRGALTLNPDYQKTLREMLQAQVKGGDFSQQTVKEINSWCSKNTYGMIDKLVEELSPAQQLVLLNAVAFEDQWSAQYKKNQVKKEYFTDQNGKKTKTDLMYSEEALYCQDDMATGFIKPYASGYQFVAILPNKGVSVAAYMKKLDGERFAAFVNSGQDAIVHAVLPAFKSEYKTDALVQIFRKMGIKNLFDASAADLSGMGDCSGQNLYVDEILHKTYIDVNREGTRAAAVTGVMVKATALQPEPTQVYTVRLDRPFLYAIVDSYTRTPVFLGTMVSAE